MDEVEVRPASNGRRREDVVAWVLMIAVVVAIAAYALYRPAGNADLVDYIATVHQWQGKSGQALSDATYADLKAFLPQSLYDDVTGVAGDPTINRNVYLRQLAADPQALTEQIPFYSVKPLYPGLMFVLTSLGVQVGFASVLISAVAYALLGLLLFGWFRRHLGPWRSLLAATLLVISPPFWVLSHLSTPDALCLLLVATALFVLVELRRPIPAIAILLVSILARPNAVVITVALLAAMVVARQASGIRIRWWVAGIGAVAAVGLVLVLQRLSGNYGLGVLFYHAVIAYLPYPTQGAPAVALSEVARIYAFRIVQLATSPVPLFTLLGVLALYLRLGRVREVFDDAASLAVLAALLAMVPGWLTYPNEPERILVGSFLAAIVVLIVSTGRQGAVAAEATGSIEPIAAA
ncbi:MAG TPA: glycosyltransferase family 39 protein [Candidatus Limnocylindrales bacterium]